MSRFTKVILGHVTIVALLFTLAHPLSADQKRGAEASHSHASDGVPVGKAVQFLSLGGYDPVSYVDTNEAKPGTAAYQYHYEDITFQFSSEKNMKKFMAKPQQYMPAFGGHCVKSLVQGGRAKHGSPKCFKVIKGKTHLFSSEAAMMAFEKGDQMKQMKMATENYKKLMKPRGGRGS